MTGMLAIWHDVAAGREAEVRTWYAQEHHFERLAVPGFQEARRFDRIEGQGQAILGLYRVDSPAVLRSQAYLDRLATPSERTRQVMPHYRNMSRTVCTVHAQDGRAEGGHVAALALPAGMPPAARDVRAALHDVPGVLRWLCLIAEDADTSAPVSTKETALRGGPDAGVAWALIIDTDGPESARAALRASRPLAAGVTPSQAGMWRLAFAARNPA